MSFAWSIERMERIKDQRDKDYHFLLVDIEIHVVWS